MKLGLLVTPGSEAAAQVQAAERAGFESAFFVDSPMLFGDVFTSMAAAAVQTSRIRLGTGVTNPLTRSVPVLASCAASLNALAPGRIILGFGRGFTANFTMGHRNATIAEMDTAMAQLRSLWAGETVETTLVDDQPSFVALLNSTAPWMNVEDPLPIHLAASGPKTLRFAGANADGVILGGITNPEIIRACLAFAEEGTAQRADGVRALEIAITPSTYVSPDPLSHDDLVALLGPKSLAPAMNFAGMAEIAPGVDPQVAAELKAVKAAYRPDEVEGEDPRKRHLRSFRGYMTSLKDWQVPLVTEHVLASTSISGTPDDAVARIRALEAAGITRVILSPLPQHVAETIEIFRTGVIPHVGGDR